MTALSNFINSSQATLRLSPEPADIQNMPILRLCRLYCLMAVAAALLVSICIYFDYWIWSTIDLSQTELFRSGLSGHFNWSGFILILNWAGLFVLLGGVFYAFKIAGQARVDADRNASLLREAEQRRLEIKALYDSSVDAAVHDDLSALLESILERAKKMLSAAGCAVFLYDSEHDDFQIKVEVGVGMPIGTRLSRHDGLAGRVADTLEPLIINNYANWPFSSTALKHLPISAAMCVPMVRGGKLIGVLGVHEIGENKREFTEAEAHLLSLFADEAAGAVHNARLLEALRNSEARFRIAAECASDMVYDWDLLEDRVEYFGALLDKTRAHGETLPSTRREYWESIHPEDRARIEESLRDHFETGRAFSEEYRILVGRNACVSVADRASAIRNEEGKCVRLIGTVSDITDRKHSEQMKSDFVSFVTHQLRTPLSGVKWMLELATDTSANPEDVQSFIRDAAVSTERLIGLVNDLLDISRLERGRLQISHKYVDLAGLTRDVVHEMTPFLLEKDQTLSFHVDGDSPKPYADEQLLRQVVLNLVSNAVKYTPSGGRIDIHLIHDADQIRWSVKDNGIGIPGSALGKLFEKFYRAGNALSVETEGTGLGLYLVRLIVERFEGSISCESEEGVGSTFLFTLPLVAGEV